MNERIQILEPYYMPIMLRDRYEFRKERPAHWLQRLLLWGLRKLRCQAWDEELRTRVIDTKSVLDAIRKQQIAAMTYAHREPMEMLIGREDFDELMNSVGAGRYGFEFNIPADSQRPRFMGMRVRVVPWIRGVVVCPARM